MAHSSDYMALSNIERAQKNTLSFVQIDDDRLNEYVADMTGFPTGYDAACRLLYLYHQRYLCQRRPGAVLWCEKQMEALQMAKRHPRFRRHYPLLNFGNDLEEAQEKRFGSICTGRFSSQRLALEARALVPAVLAGCLLLALLVLVFHIDFWIAWILVAALIAAWMVWVIFGWSYPACLASLKSSAGQLDPAQSRFQKSLLAHLKAHSRSS